MPVPNPVMPVKGAGTTLWVYKGNGDPYANPLSDVDWSRLAKVKDLTPGELTAESYDDSYLDDEDADWTATGQGQKSAGDTSFTLAWMPGEQGQQALLAWFNEGDTRAYKIRFSEKRIADIRQVETTARYLGTGLYWIAASINIKPGHDYYFYIRSVNTVGKSAFVEAVGRASDDAEGYLDFFKGKITESHLGKELLEKVDLTEDNASRLDQFSKEWKDANDKWNAMWGVKIEQTEDGKHYVAGLGLSMEDTEEGKLSQFLVAANRIAFIDPSNGNTRPMFVGQGDQIFMNDVFLKRLTAPTITSGGNPPAFSLTPDGRLTAKNADISGNVNANSGTLNNVTINENCRVLGKLSANQIEGDLVKTVGKAFPRDSRAPERWPSGTITVRVYDDQPFDRQIVIPAVAFSGAKHEKEHTDIYSSCRLIVRKNGAEIYNRTALDNTLIYSGVIDMPAGHGHMTLEFSVSAWLVNNWYPTASISDLLVVVMKKATAGITIS